MGHDNANGGYGEAFGKFDVTQWEISAMARNTNEVVIWYNQVKAEKFLEKPKEQESFLDSAVSYAEDAVSGIVDSALAIIGYESDETEDGELGNVWFQNVRVSQKSRAVKVPLEDGSIVFDHKVNDPAIITMRIAIKRYSNSLANKLLHKLSSSSMPETWQDTYLKLKAMFNANTYTTDPLGYDLTGKSVQYYSYVTDETGKEKRIDLSPYAIVQTGSQVFKNMMMTGLNAVEDNQHFDYLQYDLEFTQQLLRNAENEILPESAEDKTSVSFGEVFETAVSQGVGTATSIASFV